MRPLIDRHSRAQADPEATSARLFSEVDALSLRSEKAQILEAGPLRASEPVRVAGVEFSGFPCVQSHRSVTQDQTEPAPDHVDPFESGVCFQRAELRRLLAVDDVLERLDADGTLTQRKDGLTIDLLWRDVNSRVSDRRRSDELIEWQPVDARQKEGEAPGWAFAFQTPAATRCSVTSRPDRPPLRGRAPAPDADFAIGRRHRRVTAE